MRDICTTVMLLLLTVTHCAHQWPCESYLISLSLPYKNVFMESHGRTETDIHRHRDGGRPDKRG